MNFLASQTKHDFFLDYGSDYRNSIFLSGVSRSGTTWASNIINYRNEYRYIFEPFDSDRVEICQKFKDRQYLKPDNQDEAFLKVANAILTGKIKSKWTDKFNKKRITNKRLIKDTRANFLLKYLKVNFPELKIILLLRHPCAVANSRIKLKWATNLDKYLLQNDLMQEYLNPFRQYIQDSQTLYKLNREDIFENSIFAWCCQNYVPLKQFKFNEICIVFYENLCIDPEMEIKKIFSFLGKSYEENVLESLEQPSQVTRKDSSISTGDNLVNGWRNHITDEQITRAVKILSLFGLDEIYSEKSLPNTDNLRLVMKT